MNEARSLRRGSVSALNVCHVVGRPAAAVDEPALVGQLATHETDGRPAGERAEIARQVRLIGIATGIRRLTAIGAPPLIP
jgi:hypothetical protein